MSDTAASTTVSVLIPAYNCSATIEAAVHSALNQAGGHQIEVLVCDDCSSDDSVRTIERLAAGDARVTLLKNARNSGVSHTRNHLLDRATGTWIALLDADDIFLPGKITRCIAELEASGADLLYHDLGYLRGDGSIKGKIEGILFPQATMFSRRSVGEVRFNTSLMAGEDSDFFRRVREGYKCIYLNEVLTGLRIQPGSLTDKNWLLKRVVEHWHNNAAPGAEAPANIDGYMGYYRQIPTLERLNLYRQWLGQKYGRLGAGHFFAGHKPKGLLYITLSSLINPAYIVSRVANKLGLVKPQGPVPS